jgi:hypothetical protein
MELETYICSCCGKVTEQIPALAYDAPDNYYGLSDSEKDEIAELDPDLCVITYDDQKDYFIRVVMMQILTDSCECLEYGVWVSVSEKSFTDYKINYHNANHEAMYFGWLCNNFPDYDAELSIPTSVFTQKDGQRPYIVPHEDCPHPLAEDFRKGITLIEAKKRVKRAFGI